MTMNVLLIEDDVEDAEAIRRMLQAAEGAAVACQCVGRLEQGLGRLQQDGVDVVLLDMALPGTRGTEALVQVRAAAPDVPIVVLTGLDDDEAALRAVGEGAQDYLVKGEVNGARLARALRHAIERSRAERQFRILAEQSPNMIFINCGGRLAYVNSRCVKVLGYSREEFYAPQFDFCKLIATEHRERVERSFRRHAAGEEVAPYECAIVTRDGRRMDVIISTTLIDQRGEPAVLGTVTDITPQKRAADALAEMARHWESTFDAIDDLVCIMGPDRQILRANAAMTNALSQSGLDPADSCAAFHSRPPPSEQCLAVQALSSGRLARATFFSDRLRGRWFDIRCYPIRDEQGGTVQLVHVARDITERKLAEQELEAARQFANTVIETAGALIVVLDTDGRVVRFNRACEICTGYSAEEVEGCELMETLVPLEEREGVREVFRSLLGEADFCTYENHWVTRSGERRLVSWANSRVCDQNGQVQWVIGTGIDVTEQRRLQERLQRAAKLEAVGQLAGGVAHDFNNLLTAILGYVELNLSELTPGTPLHEDLTQVRRAARRAADLVRQLLTFSRRPAGERVVIDLSACTRDTTRMIRHLIEENIETTVELSDEPLPVLADPSQMGQVLVNLVVNARDAMPGGGELFIRTSRQDMPAGGAGEDAEPRPHAVLTVRDSGTGMTPEVRERIFDPFFTTKEVGHGTGLGLSSVYGIVQGHGGYVECESEPGQGATFHVCLPLAEEEAVPPDSSTLDFLSGRGETVLVVEDDPEVRNLTTRALTDFGYTVLSAADGPEALRVLDEHPAEIDLLLTDIVLPSMDGRELAQRARLKRPTLRLLFMSGYAESPPTGAPEDLEQLPVLHKPFTAVRLAKHVREAMEGS